MKKIFITLSIFTLMLNSANAGALENAEIINTSDASKLNISLPQIIEADVVFSFASNAISSVSSKKIGNVVAVDYLYSQYKRADVFAQSSLDKQRLEALFEKFPQLKNDKNISWRIIGQAADSYEKATLLFHGFKIYYQPTPTKEEMVKEMALLDEMVLGKKAVTEKHDIVHSVVEKRDVKWISKVEDLSAIEVGYSGPLGATYIPYSGPDSVVTAVFNRNKSWKNMCVLTDVTGSMYPYIGQVFAWYKLNSLNKKVQNFYFFNDGDMRSDNSKISGKVGGIYSTRALDFDSVYTKAKYAMSRGFGGDGPENNVEALLAAQKQTDETTSFVMIADNWATPRDLLLLSDVKRPVKVILCGGVYGINVEYINLAYKTGGSVHTIEQDITDLALKHDGETVKIGKQTFLLKEGAFIAVKSI
ncbi:MAG: hypothetical protein NT150_01375 [Bacteroidetes bacterium]|nr:hypothetical protein [Bacteroidota bacterium]